jgi:peroxiredoxin
MFKGLLLICAFLALTAGCSEKRPLETGMPAPEISALDMNDKVVKLSEFRGKVVVLRFWTGECKSCLNEMPKLEEIYKRYRERGFEILAIYRGGSGKDEVEAIAGRLKISYPVFTDQLMIASRKYRVTGVPMSFVIDRNGVLREIIIGETPVEALEKKLEALL